MAVLTASYITEALKDILPFGGDTDIYDTQLNYLVMGAISKLEGEGLDINATDTDGEYVFQEDTNNGMDYIMCVSYQVMKDMDYDVNMDYLTEQYITRVGTLRLKVSIL